MQSYFGLMENEMIETASIFAGVNEGYQGDKEKIADPVVAAGIVRECITDIAAALGDRNAYTICPGVVIYPVDRGCPHGGEAMAAITTGGNPNDVLEMAASLRERLRQTTLSVVTYAGSHGEQTREFTASVARNIGEIAPLWQAAAADYNARHGIHVSCGMYDIGNGTTIIRAAANPANVNVAQWENAAREVAAIVGRQSGIAIDPAFRNAGFTHLQKPAA